MSFAEGSASGKKERVGVIVQTRMGSKRLPGKALIPIYGQPLLLRAIERARLCRSADQVVVATSQHASSDPIEAACQQWGLPCFRGPEVDLTSRLLGACRHFGLSIFARWTGDNPLTDPEAIDEMIRLLQKTGSDLVHNAHRSGYPYGMGAEVIRQSALEACDLLLEKEADREFVASFLDEHPEQFKVLRLPAPPHLRRPGYFLTVDYPEDVELITEVYRHFSGRSDVTAGEVVSLLDSRPDLVALNAHLHAPFPV